MAARIMEGLALGQAFGEGMARRKYTRGERELQERYEREAAAAGMTLDEYLQAAADGAPAPRMHQYESELEDLYYESGAAKRGVTDRFGRALHDVSRGALGGRAERFTGRAAGTRALGGDVAGARDTMARGAYAQGDFEGGIGQQQAAGITRATTAAIGQGPQGGYGGDVAAEGISKIGAQFGNHEVATAGDQQARDFRMQAAQGIAGRIGMAAADPANFGDQIPGLWEGLKRYVPELMPIEVRPMENGEFAIFTNGKATGSVNSEELQGMVSQFMQSPEETFAGLLEARRGAAAHQTERQEKLIDDNRASARNLIEEFAKSGVDPKLVEAAISVKASLQKSGWEEIHVDPETGGIRMVAPNGQLVNVVPGSGITVDGIDADPNAFRILDQDGRELDPAQLQGGEMALELASNNARLMMAAVDRMETGRLMTAMELLNSIGGTPTVAGPRAGLYEAIEQVESGGNENAVSPKGALGPMQTMPGTLRDPGFGVAPARDNSPEEMRRVGQDYIDAMIERYGDERAALAAYNWGPDNVDKALAATGGDVDAMLASAPAETQAYVPKVLALLGGAPTRAPDVAPGGRQRSPTALPTAAQTANAAPLRPDRNAALDAMREAEQWEAELAAYDRENPQPALPYYRGASADKRAMPKDPLRQRIVQARDAAVAKAQGLATASRTAARTAALDSEFAAIKARVAGGRGVSETAATDPQHPLIEGLFRGIQ